MRQNVEKVLERVDANDPMVENMRTVAKHAFEDSNRNLFNHMLLSGKNNSKSFKFLNISNSTTTNLEYTDRIDQLPPELVDAIRHGGGANIYEQVQTNNNPTVRANTNNPFLLFLQTLLPGQIPNAPAEQQQPQQGGANNDAANQQAWFNGLVEWFNNQGGGNEEEWDDEPDQEQNQ